MSTYEMLAVCISSFALLVAIFTFLNNIKDKIKSKAPFLIAEKEELYKCPFDKYKLDEKASYDSADYAQFTLDSRIFIDNNPEDGKDSYTLPLNSLILDTRKKESNYNRKDASDIKLINFCGVTIRNIGFDMIKLELNSVKITYKSNDSLTLKPNKHNKLNLYKKYSETFDLALSFIFYDDSYALMDKNKLAESFQTYFKYIGDNLFNCYLPETYDKYKFIEFFVTTTNKFNKKYKQLIQLQIENNVYSTYSKHL